MRSLILLIIFSLYSAKVSSQEELDLGIFAGTSYYLGNINTSQHFYKLSPAIGALAKYNFNEHYAIRLGFNWGQFRADDMDFDNILHQTRESAFINNFYDFSLQGEFSFHPFKVTIFSRPYSTYVTAGLSYTFTDRSPDPSTSYLNIPFGLGFKYGISRKVSLGVEWIMKKSFADDLDGVKSFGQFDSPSLVHNNDWVSLAGIFITIKPFERRGDCPPYWN